MGEALGRLGDALMQGTQVYRKGEVVTEKVDGALRIVNIDAFPALPEGREEVADVHFVYVGKAESGPRSEEEWRSLLEDALAEGEGLYLNITRERAREGPSYIEWGAWLGDQTLALQLLGIGQLLGWWKVVTPEQLGIEGEQAEQMAGHGFVMNSGLLDQAEEPS